ncbi:hypothetical protein K8I61_14335, partial [bacterium]|nr:hypothetical protein [bacterium]
MTEEGTANSRKNSTARPLAPPSRLISFFALLLLSLPLIFALPGCSCGDDDDSARDGIAYDDSGFDDDADDDDNAGDDDDDDDDD